MEQFMPILALCAGIVSFVIIFYLRKKYQFGFITVIALCFGILLGFLFKGHTDYLAMVGTIFVKVISMMVIPLLVVSLIKSFISMDSLKGLQKVGLKSVFWLLFQTLLAATVGVILAMATGLGKGSQLALVQEYTPKEIPPFTQVITDLFSNNVFASMAEGKLIPVVFFSIIVGIAVVSLESKNKGSMKVFKDLIESLHQIIYTIVRKIIRFLPFAIVSLLANTVSQNDIASLRPLMLLIVLTFVGCFIHIYLTGGILIATVGKLNPLKYFSKIFPAQAMAFTTQSSAGTLPVYIDCLTKKIGVSSSIANFVGPLGTTVGMAGCAGVWPVLLGVFAFNATGVEITVIQCITMVLLCPIVSLGTAGVPGGGILIGTAFFMVLGLPVEYIGIFAGIDAFVDMARTTANVSSSMVSATLTATSENEVDLSVFEEEASQISV